MNVNISSIRLNCNDVARFLAREGISSNVTTNKSVVCSDKENTCFFETGCSIKLSRYDADFFTKTWPQMQKKFDLNCAHVNINYDGCVKRLLNEK